MTEAKKMDSTKAKAFLQLANGIPDFARNTAKLFTALGLVWGSPSRVPDGVDIALNTHRLLEHVRAKANEDGNHHMDCGRIRVEWIEETEDESGHAAMSFIFAEDFYGEEDDQ